MNRIKAIASLVDNDALVVDIGTDHAYLPIYLYENDITKNIVASDISSNALLFAKNNLEKHNLRGKIKLVVSDGFKNLDECFDIAIISGVGTETIKKILDNEVLPNKLILSSHKNVSDLREYMFKIGYKIEKEIIVYENNIYYNIIKYIKGKDNLSKYDLLVGLSNDINYKKHLLNKYKEIYEKSHDKKYLEYINIIKRKQD
uniref:class I SAM-dependent methyltransferase n=1 Tax=Candidatus Onthocola sp. TaxID=3085646 RepID=UPI003FEF4782